MADADWVRQEAARSLGRLWPRLEARFREQAAAMPAEWSAFAQINADYFASK